MSGQRYSRQVLFAPIGAEGQDRLRAAQVVIMGCGALGSAHSEALVRAGVGRVRIVDRDFVEESNLQRQILFDEDDARQALPKAVAAERKLARINSDVRVEGLVADVDARNVEELVRGFDVILDGMDNFVTRYLVNDAAVKLGIPWVYGAAVSSYAATMTILPGRTACLACVFPEQPQGMQMTCETSGVISPAVTWASSIQVAETLKLLVGREEALHGLLLNFDVWNNQFQQVRPKRDAQCRACARREFVYLDAGAPIETTLCGRDAVQIRPREAQQLDLAALGRRLEQFGAIRANEYLLRCTLAPYELTIFSDGRMIVKGTSDPSVARSVYAKYIGA